MSVEPGGTPYTSPVSQPPDAQEPAARSADAAQPNLLPDEQADDFTRRGWTYQEVFRALGAMLDEDITGWISIVEVGDGFLLRRQRLRQSLTEVALTSIERSALLRRAARLRLEPGDARVNRHPGIWSAVPSTHQDFFRALGYELDSVGARRIMIDELSNGLLLMYEQAAHEGYEAGMRRVVIGTPEIEEILNEAVRRRRDPHDGKRSGYLQGASGEPHEMGVRSREETSWTIPRTGIPYQGVLRSIGWTLDRRGAEQVSLLEGPDGFQVRYQPPYDNQLIWARFRDDDQRTDGPANRQKPGLLHRSASADPGGYSDLFRALGYELQQLLASNILIAEQEDGFAVTYQYHDHRGAMSTQRTMLLFGKKEQEELIRQARARRKPDTSFRARIARR